MFGKKPIFAIEFEINTLRIAQEVGLDLTCWRRKRSIFGCRRRGNTTRRIRAAWEPFCGCVEGYLIL